MKLIRLWNENEIERASENVAVIYSGDERSVESWTLYFQGSQRECAFYGSAWQNYMSWKLREICSDRRIWFSTTIIACSSRRSVSQRIIIHKLYYQSIDLITCRKLVIWARPLSHLALLTRLEHYLNWGNAASIISTCLSERSVIKQ